MTGGEVAKQPRRTAVGAAPAAWSTWVAVLLPRAAVGTALLMIRCLLLTWARPLPASHAFGASGPSASWALLLAASTVTAPFLITPGLCSGSTDAVLPSAADALGPVLTALAWAAVRLARHRPDRAPRLPAGDISVGMAWLGAVAAQDQRRARVRARDPAARIRAMARRWPRSFEQASALQPVGRRRSATNIDGAVFLLLLSRIVAVMALSEG